MARMQRSLFAQLNALAEEISQGAVKTAATKAAENPTPADPGTYTGASTHPTAHVDNNVQAATTGSRASEYEADIKKQQGALAVDNTPELPQEGRQDQVQLNIGTNAAATGEDPASEHDYKGDKDDPGTSHPAKANDGEKYSSVTFKQAHAKCSNLGNDILAALLNASTEKAAEMPAFLKEKIESKKNDGAKGNLKGDQHKIDVDNDGKIEGSDLASLRNDKAAAFNAGYELAAALGMDKAAAEASVREVCAHTLREADEMADLFVGFVNSKVASADPSDEAAEGEDHSAMGDDASGANPADAAGGEAPAGMDMAAAGMDPAAAGMGDEGGEAAPSEDEAVQELAMALEELGIPPEALIQAVQAQGGGADAGAGAGADMGAAMGAPPEAAPKMAAANDLNSIGNVVVNFKRSGKFQVKEARTKRSRQLRDIMKQHVIELVNR
jgi:hypothetical protein